MRGRQRIQFVVLAGLCAAIIVGCEPADTPPPDTVVLEGPPVEAAVDYSDLAAVLQHATDSAGMVRSIPVRDFADRLDTQLKRFAVTGPTATPELLPTSADRLAYWYNARCAWSLKLLMRIDFPFEAPAARIQQRPFPIDGRVMTLAQIDEAILAEGGWQALVAAPGVSMLRARLLSVPAEPGQMATLVQERLDAFLSDGKRFVIDIVAREIRVPPVLWQFRDSLIGQHERTYSTVLTRFTTSLLPYTYGVAQQRLQDAIGYTCVRAENTCDLAVKDYGPQPI